jgi:peptidoglycan/LPS O-acetylase OafA/YrhL
MPPPAGKSASVQESRSLSTAYLDGLRGIATLLVYWHHHILWFHADSRLILEAGFGFESQHHFATLPGVRTFFTGAHFAVATFFVISGYTMSLRALAAIHEQNQARLADSLASSISRRWLRLYLPLASTSLAFVGTCYLFDLQARGVTRQQNWLSELWKWNVEFWRFSFVFDESGLPWFSYNDQLWTIPVEFKASCVVYATLLAVSRASAGMRVALLTGLIVYFLFLVDGWYVAMSLSGSLLCDFNLQVAQNTSLRAVVKVNAGMRAIRYPLLLMAIYLAGVPHYIDLAEHPGWYYLSLLKPHTMQDPKWFFLFWAGTLLVALVPHFSWLKLFLEGWCCQYLGRVSYAVYLVHGPVLWTLGNWVYRHVEIVGRQSGVLGMNVDMLVSHLVLFPCTIGIAEVARRLVDDPSVRFSRYLYRKVTAANGKD